VWMMADVACFCGCCFTFDGAGAACPKCGEYASLMPEPATESAGQGEQKQHEPVGLIDHTPKAFPEWVEAGALTLSDTAV
jgi:hypothetical protein